MKSTNRRWQNHLRSKGFNNFMHDRLKSHALSSDWQYEQSPFYFPISEREQDDELTKYYFAAAEEFPDEFYLELTSRCNLNCKMCARSAMTRQHGTMSNELFFKIIDEIAANNPAAYLHYYGIGESTLDPELFTKLTYAKKRGLTNSILFTNGQNLLDYYQALATAGLASIGVDLDGFTPETYAKIRIGGDFAKVKTGIEVLAKYLRDNNLRTRLEIAYQIYPGINEQEIGPFIVWCQEYGLEYKLVNMHSWSGLRKDVPQSKVAGLTDEHHSQRSGPCCYLWTGVMVAWDGRVATCFQDADLRGIMGDLKLQTIKEIWQGNLRNKRRQQLQGLFTGICQNCDSGTNVNLPVF